MTLEVSDIEYDLMFVVPSFKFQATLCKRAWGLGFTVAHVPYDKHLGAQTGTIKNRSVISLSSLFL